MPGTARSENPQQRSFAGLDALNSALAQDITQALRQGLDARRSASLAVPGGRTPVGLFELLSNAPLEWRRVRVTLTDERWVDPASADSNEQLVRAHLLKGAAAAAGLTGLKNSARDPESGAAASWSGLAALPRPFDFVLLGMGDDGHFASLFPHAPELAAALDPNGAPGCVPMRAPVPPFERLSLNLSALLDARQIGLLIAGETKRVVLERARTDGSAADLPVRALLRQQRVPVTVFWSP
jgi:6-phosphogluconolactonase